MKVLGPQEISQPGDLAEGLRTPREYTFEGQWDLITGLPQDWVNRLLEGTNKTLCAPGPRRKEHWSHKRLNQTCLWVFGSLWQRCGSTLACPRPETLSAIVLGYAACWHKSWRRLPLPLPGFGFRPSHQQKIGLKIYWTWPCPSEQDTVFTTVSISHQEASTSFYPHPLEGRQNANHNPRKPNWSHGSQFCLTQWNYEACHVGPPKMDGGEFWQNVVHWRREWQITSAFLSWGPHGQYEKIKRYEIERWSPQESRCPIYCWRRAEM